METVFINLTGLPVVVINGIVSGGGGPMIPSGETTIPPNLPGSLGVYDGEESSIGEILVVRHPMLGLPAPEPDKDYKFYIVPAKLAPFVPQDRPDVLWPVNSVEEGEIIRCTGLEGRKLPVPASTVGHGARASAPINWE